MNYQGQPCKGCGEIIEVHCLSGLCRECFHKKRGGKTFPGSKLLRKVKRKEK